MNALDRPAATCASLEAHGLSARYGAGDDDDILDDEAEPLEDDHYPGNDEYEEVEEDEL